MLRNRFCRFHFVPLLWQNFGRTYTGMPNHLKRVKMTLKSGRDVISSDCLEKRKSVGKCQTNPRRLSLSVILGKQNSHVTCKPIHRTQMFFASSFVQPYLTYATSSSYLPCRTGFKLCPHVTALISPSCRPAADLIQSSVIWFISRWCDMLSCGLRGRIFVCVSACSSNEALCVSVVYLQLEQHPTRASASFCILTQVQLNAKANEWRPKASGFVNLCVGQSESRYGIF